MKRVAAISLLVVSGGLVAGLIADLLVLTLRGVSWLAFGHSGEPAVSAADIGSDPVSFVRRLAGPIVGGVVGGFVWWRLRRDGAVPSVDAMIRGAVTPSDAANRRARPVWLRAAADAVTQIVVVASGASIGREAAPRLAAAGVMNDLSARVALPGHVRRVLIAAAAGSGLAAVYNVPVTGVIYTATIILAAREAGTVPAVGAAGKMRELLPHVFGTGWSALVVACTLPMSIIATVTAWPVIGSGPRFDVPDLAFTAPDALFVLVGGVAAGTIGYLFGALSRAARRAAPRPGWRLPAEIALAGLAVGLASYWLPIGGNGLLLIDTALVGTTPFVVLAVYIVAKPLFTAAYLRGGAVGGLLMPALSTGAALGGVAAVVTGQPAAAGFAMIGAVAVLAASEKGWLFAAALGWELTHAPWQVGLCLVAAAAIGHLTAIGLDRAGRRSRSQ